MHSESPHADVRNRVPRRSGSRKLLAGAESSHTAPARNTRSRGAAPSWTDASNGDRDDRPATWSRARVVAQLRRWVELRPIELIGLSALLAAASLLTAGLALGAAGRPPANVIQSDAAAALSTLAAGSGTPTSGGYDHADPSVSLPAPDVQDGAHAPTGAAGGRVTMHVAGAVTAPGVITLVDGSRVVDAIAAAGGAVDDADLHSINLARLVDDGEHLYVPRVGEDPPPVMSSERSDGRVDLNRAGVEQLQQLPGVGPSRAEAIVRHREQHGPFRVPGDIRNVSGIGDATFQNMADRLVVR